MNRRDFLAGLVCAVATVSLDIGGSTSLAITPPPEQVPTEPISDNDLTGLKLDYVRRDGAEAAAIVIGTTDIIGTGAIIVATATARVEPGAGRRGERCLGAASEYARRPSGASLADGMDGIRDRRYGKGNGAANRSTEGQPRKKVC